MNTHRNPLNCIIFSVFFIVQGIVVPTSYAGPITVPALPKPGSMVSISDAFRPVNLKGIMVHPDNPFVFDVLINSGDTDLQGEQIRPQAMELIKYFMAALAVPEKELWVNLSPYEKNRIISTDLQSTTLGREMLAQDYLLKQLTASLTHPDQTLGQKFWEKVYEKVRQSHAGLGQVPVDMGTFNKVWIMPDQAKVYEQSGSAVVVASRLKVLLEEDYMSINAHQRSHAVNKTGSPPTHTAGSQALKEIIVPILEQEVNEGAQFASLRQLYHAVILASWYKIRLKQSILTQVYADQGKTRGIAVKDNSYKENIYQQYLAAYKKGAYNIIKEEADPQTQKQVARKYISGGATFDGAMSIVRNNLVNDAAQLSREEKGFNSGRNTLVGVSIRREAADEAMTIEEIGNHLELLQRTKQALTSLSDQLKGGKVSSNELMVFKQLNWNKKTEDLYRKLINNLLTYSQVNRKYKVVIEVDKHLGTFDVLISSILNAPLDHDLVLKLEAFAGALIAVSLWYQQLDPKIAIEDNNLIEKLKTGGADTLSAVVDVLSLYLEGQIERRDLIEQTKADDSDSGKMLDAVMEGFIFSNTAVDNGNLDEILKLWKTALRKQLLKLVQMLEDIYPSARNQPLKKKKVETFPLAVEQTIEYAQKIREVIKTQDIKQLMGGFRTKGLVIYNVPSDIEDSVPNNVVEIANDILKRIGESTRYHAVTSIYNNEYGKHMVAAVIPFDETDKEEDLRRLNMKLRVGLAMKIAVEQFRLLILSQYDSSIGESEAVKEDLYDYLNLDLNLQIAEKRDWDQRIQATTEHLGIYWRSLKVELINNFHRQIKLDSEAFSQFPYTTLDRIVDRTLELMKFKELGEKESAYAHVFFYPEQEDIIRKIAASEIRRDDALKELARIYNMHIKDKQAAEKHAKDLLAFTESMYSRAAADVVKVMRPGEGGDNALIASGEVQGGIDFNTTLDLLKGNLDATDTFSVINVKNGESLNPDYFYPVIEHIFTSSARFPPLESMRP